MQRGWRRGRQVDRFRHRRSELDERGVPTGIGGGAIMAPFFVSVFGLPVYTVAGAALMGTLITSVAGVAIGIAAVVALTALAARGLPGSETRPPPFPLEIDLLMILRIMLGIMAGLIALLVILLHLAARWAGDEKKPLES